MIVALTPSILGHACRIFLDAAYPRGPHTIPAPKRVFLHIDSAAPLDNVLQACGHLCQRLRGGYAFRIGSETYPHVKLKVELVEADGAGAWIFSVDTHDAFSQHDERPPPDHPDEVAWMALQAANRVLKEQIEAAWEAAGLSTLNSLLRKSLVEK